MVSFNLRKDNQLCINKWVDIHKEHKHQMYLGSDTWIDKDTAFNYLLEDVDNNDEISTRFYFLLNEIYPDDTERQKNLWIAITTILCIANECKTNIIPKDKIKEILDINNVSDAYKVLSMSNIINIY